MQQNKKQIFIIIPLLVFIFTGCGAQFLNRHSQATKIKPVLFSQPSSIGTWKSNEISISYSIDSYKPHFLISGTLRLNPSILSSYPVITVFFVRIYFFDAGGNILDTSPIQINFSHHSFAEEEYSFNLSRRIPVEVEAFSFSYSGTFSDYGERFPDTRTIGYSPIN